MRVIRHSADCFRNLKNTVIEADPRMNIIYGENGQGKTNLIESMWLFTGCYSFRTHKNAQLICDGEEKARAAIRFFSEAREQTAEMTVGKTKELILNGSPCDSPRAMIGKFCCVVFSPSTLSVVKDGPAERRKLLDIAISLTKPNYAVIMSRYLRILGQRNNLLRKVAEGKTDPSFLEPWDLSLATTGAALVQYRLQYLEQMAPLAAQIYGGISSSRETFGLYYSFMKNEENRTAEDIEKKLLDGLQKSREADLRRLYTGFGPHADDLILLLNNKDARAYGSQGQQRSCALALKLSEASVMGQITGEAPVVLLDDVMSELDEGRQKFILNYLDSWQVFITCCDPSQLLRSETGKVFEVKDGSVDCR